MNSLTVVGGKALSESTPLAEIKVEARALEARAQHEKARGNLEAANKHQADRIRALRLMGLIFAGLERGTNRGANQHQSGANVGGADTSSYTQAIEDCGIHRDSAHKYQKLAEVEEALLEEYFFVVEQKADDAPSKEITLAGALKYKQGAAHVKENSGENEWYTPEVYIQAAKEVMGSIDLDPCSSAIANETVGATKFFDLEDDGLEQGWEGNVWMNPPYERSLVDSFTGKLLDELHAGNIDQAIVLTNNATDTQWMQGLMLGAQAICFHEGRIRFNMPTGEAGAPLQGQAFCYFGADAEKFMEVFANFGAVFRP